MEFDLFNVLGYLSETECKNIRNMMEGRSFYHYHVGWSNCAGNCSLVVNANCEKDDLENAKSHFLSMLTREGAEHYQKADFLHRLCMAHCTHPKALVGKQGVYEADKKGDYYFFYQDAEKAHELCQGSHMSNLVDGATMAYVSRFHFENSLKPNAAKEGVEIIILEP